MPAGTLRSLLQDFSQGGDDSLAHGHSSQSADLSSFLSSGPIGRQLGWKVRAASFLDTDAVAASHRRTAFTEHSHADKHDLQDDQDSEAMKRIESKVDEKLADLRHDTERKLDDFFRTMREAYGVPFGAPALTPPARGAASASAGSLPGGAEPQQYKFRLPELPPGKHATIQLQRPPAIPAGAGQVGSQQEALVALSGRLDKLMRKLADEPDVSGSAGSAHHSAEPDESVHRQDIVSDLYRKLETLSENLDSVAENHDSSAPKLAIDASPAQVPESDHPLTSTEILEEDQEQAPAAEAPGAAPLGIDEGWSA